ncbi:hypothetical protein [Vibrio porteresiae]|uniref:Uncharacterized protein n=1 Tax=Vibrio porteresiae DSM 19223 TaxID=1123496 RepID=A0ABZ0QGJ8_9VIBR|nr:hypothetical protein [Vibrio porteresiae]WPC75627.1 hypothetical protein R8Z52_22145 [Vibrio porteresiae DSM 19223]
MFHSDIVVTKQDNQEPEQQQDSNTTKLGCAYVIERERLELTEIELNRSKIVMVDGNGRIIKLNLNLEH